MGYYDNPPIIQPSRDGEIMGEAIANFGKSIGAGLTAYGQRKEEARKEEKLTIEKLQKDRYLDDLAANEKYSDWSKLDTPINDELDAQVNNVINQSITETSSARIKLRDTTNEDERQSLNAIDRNGGSLIKQAAELKKTLSAEIKTYINNVKSITTGQPGGYTVNGSNDQEIKDNTGFIEVFRDNPRYTDKKVEVTKDKSGTGINVKVSGKDPEGKPFEKLINSASYINSEISIGNSLLSPVEDFTPFYKESTKEMTDGKKIYPGYLEETRETYDLNSKGDSGGGVGKDQYQITNGQRVRTELIMSKLEEKADAKSQAILATSSDTEIKNIIDYSLKKGIGWYNEHFKTIESPEAQKKELSKLIAKQNFDEAVKGFQTSTVGKETIYWQTDGMNISIKNKPNPVKAVSGDLDGDGVKDPKPEATTYTESYYDKLISGYGRNPGETSDAKTQYKSRQDLAENMNKLSGKAGKYKTREELFEIYKKSPIKKDGVSREEYYKKHPKEGTVLGNFNKSRPSKNGYLYVEETAGKYRAVQKYKIHTAEGRVLLALDQTANETERKLLQGKLTEARLMDWVDIHPMKPGESQEAYAKRAQKAGF